MFSILQIQPDIGLKQENFGVSSSRLQIFSCYLSLCFLPYFISSSFTKFCLYKLQCILFKFLEIGQCLLCSIISVSITAVLRWVAEHRAQQTNRFYGGWGHRLCLLPRHRWLYPTVFGSAPTHDDIF